MRLPAKVWAGLARAAWFAGWADGVESFRAARTRAASAAAILCEHAETRGAVALVGHGLMNILIAGQLRAAGWRGPRLPSQRHWGYAVYDGRAAVSIMSCRVDPADPQLQAWLKEGVSIEVHTYDHPCPCLQDGGGPTAGCAPWALWLRSVPQRG